jgi:hypothetical protein
MKKGRDNVLCGLLASAPACDRRCLMVWLGWNGLRDCCCYGNETLNSKLVQSWTVCLLTDTDRYNRCNVLTGKPGISSWYSLYQTIYAYRGIGLVHIEDPACKNAGVQWCLQPAGPFFFFIIISGVGLSPLGTAATSGLLYKPQMIDEGDCGAIGGMKIGRGNRSIRRKPAPAPLCPPQIPHDQTRARTRAAAVGSQRLTAWAMARSFSSSYCSHYIFHTISGHFSTRYFHFLRHDYPRIPSSVLYRSELWNEPFG